MNIRKFIKFGSYNKSGNIAGVLGFSMVELSVVLTIIGVTLAGALDLATNKTESDRVTETGKRLDAIEKALAAFVVKYQRLPCPADASLATSNTNAGREQTAPNSTACGTGFNFSTGGRVYLGAVPVRTLNLSDLYLNDDWDRSFSYAVDLRFANSYATNASCSGDICFKKATADSNSIIINDSTGANVASDPTNNAIYVIISHGKNGYGAWKSTDSIATKLTASSDNDEKENAGSDRTIATAGFNNIFVSKDITDTYDDITRYSSKSKLVSNLSSPTDNTSCTAALDNFIGGGTDPCPGTTIPTCRNLALALNDLCLQ